MAFMRWTSSSSQGSVAGAVDLSKIPWHQYAGTYRPIRDLSEPWVPSPYSDIQREISPTSPRLIDIMLPFPMPEYPRKPVVVGKVKRKKNHKAKGKSLRAVKQKLRKCFGKNREDEYEPVVELVPVKPEFDKVALSEWKAYGYYACPYINGVFVRNDPPDGRVLSPSFDVEALVAGLRTPSRLHPERWIPGVQHPAIPPRPKRWVTPRPHDPLPFPWECQLNPLLEHSLYGPPRIYWHMGRPPTSIVFGQTKGTIPLSDADKRQPATWPFVTHMFINALAEDPLTTFRWPVMVFNERGVICQDVFDALYENFQEFVSREEYESWETSRKTPAELAYRVREGPPPNDTPMRRIDYLGTHYMFRGLQPTPNCQGWTMFAGLA